MPEKTFQNEYQELTERSLTSDAASPLPVASTADIPATREQENIAIHLSNERTFLAWGFTAIVIIGSGVALARTLIALNTSPVLFDIIDRTRKYSLLYPTTMGLVFLVAGLIVMVMATIRYLSVQEQIAEQCYRPSSAPAIILLVIVLMLSILLAGFLLQLRGSI